MKLVAFYIRIVLDAYRDTKRIINHFNLIPLNGLKIIPKLFLIRLVYSFTFFRNLIGVKISNNSSFDNYLKEKKIYSKEITEQIDKNGFSETFNLKEEFKDKLIHEIFSNKDVKYKKINNNEIDKKILIKNENEDLSSYFRRLEGNKISKVTSFIDLKNDCSIKSLLLSKPIISLAKNYLNTNTFSISAAFFVSTPGEISREEKYANAQYFHWDNDFSKFFKLYIYLTDVDDNSGPHIFIPKTHKKKKFRTSLARLYDDDLIYNLYKKKIKFKGKSGSIFFTDGYGLHKGETPTKNSRLIINVHFGRGKIFYSDKDIFYNSSN